MIETIEDATYGVLAGMGLTVIFICLGGFLIGGFFYLLKLAEDFRRRSK